MITPEQEEEIRTVWNYVLVPFFNLDKGEWSKVRELSDTYHFKFRNTYIQKKEWEN